MGFHNAGEPAVDALWKSITGLPVRKTLSPITRYPCFRIDPRCLCHDSKTGLPPSCPYLVPVCFGPNVTMSSLPQIQKFSLLGQIVDLANQAVKPRRFLQKDKKQDQTNNWNGNNGINDRQDCENYQGLRLEFHETSRICCPIYCPDRRPFILWQT